MKPVVSKHTLVFYLALVLCLGALAAAGIIFIKFRKQHFRLTQSESMLQKLREEEARLTEEKNKITKENEKLKADTISYLGINTKLQDEKDSLAKRLDEGQKLLERKEAEVQRVKLELDQIKKSLQDEKNTQKKKAVLTKEETLKKKLEGLEGALRKERALYHYNLGVAYAKANLYKEAESAYEKSLEFDPLNADAHYNVGLLYDNYEYDPYLAGVHFKKYLELKPEALDRDEVEGWIKKINE